jgi:cytoskeleton protein RodZ
MTDSTETTSEAQVSAIVEDPAAALGEQSYGRRLAAERERQGISVSDMASRLRLHPRQIVAIEEENLDQLPGGPFVRGFVRNYAKELHVDAAPLLAALNARLSPPDVSGGEETSTGPAQAVRDATRERVSRGVVIVGAVGALVVFGIIGWLSTQSSPPRDAQRAVEAPATVPMPPPATEAPTAAAESISRAPTPEAAIPPALPAAPAETPAPAPAVPPAPLSQIRLGFSERAWVEVTQADGRVLLSQNNDPGSVQRLNGQPPFKLVIGNAPAVTLEYRGKVIDLKPLTSFENVARVTLD